MWLLAALGCSGDDSFTIPEYVGDQLVEGDCPDASAPTGVASIQVFYAAADPLLTFDSLPAGVGTAITDEESLIDFMVGLNFGEYPIVDFSRDQVAAVWYEQEQACALNLASDDVVAREGSSGDVVIDVTFEDTGLNCDSVCTLSTRALALVILANTHDLGFCRRVNPGCPPE